MYLLRLRPPTSDLESISVRSMLWRCDLRVPVACVLRALIRDRSTGRPGIGRDCAFAGHGGSGDGSQQVASIELRWRPGRAAESAEPRLRAKPTMRLSLLFLVQIVLKGLAVAFRDHRLPLHVAFDLLPGGDRDGGWLLPHVDFGRSGFDLRPLISCSHSTRSPPRRRPGLIEVLRFLLRAVAACAAPRLRLDRVCGWARFRRMSFGWLTFTAKYGGPPRSGCTICIRRRWASLISDASASG